MKHFNGTLFLKQDIFTKSTFLFWLLSLLSGATIIYSLEFLGGTFRLDNVYAMFSTFSEWLLLFVAANLFGKEFYYKTINMIRISKKGHSQILLRKWGVMISLCILTALVSFLEVALYVVISGREVELFVLLGKLILAYCVYGTFIFSLATSIVMLVKNTLYTFLTLFVTVAFAPLILNILSGIGVSKRILKLIPFSFMRDSFSFTRYNGSQIAVIGIWSVLLIILSYTLLKKKGYA